jgi:DNA recombination-dependent growth factor C
MALLKGSVTYLRFTVPTDLPDGYPEPFCDLIAQHGFREIDPHSDQDESVGWVRFDDAFSSEHDPATLVDEHGYLLLRLRIDRLKVPTATLNAFVARAEREKAAERGGHKLSRAELTALKLEINKRLRLRSLPRMQLIEIAWQVQTGDVRLFSTSSSVVEMFTNRFKQTFGQEPLRVDLQSVLRLRDWKQDDIDALAFLAHERFHLVPGG